MCGSKLTNLLERLRRQHVADLVVYRKAHTDWRNRWLHHVLIPVEYASFSVFVSILTGPLTTHLMGWTVGLLSLAASTRFPVGLLSFGFSVLCAGLANRMVAELGALQCLILSSVSWFVAWGLQVGVGHFVWEQNSPNVANMNNVSWLAMYLSVLIAWSS